MLCMEQIEDSFYTNICIVLDIKEEIKVQY